MCHDKRTIAHAGMCSPHVPAFVPDHEPRTVTLLLVLTLLIMQSKGTFILQPPAMSAFQPQGMAHCATEYTGAVTIDVRGDLAFEDFVLGSRLLRFEGLTLQNVPKRWRLPANEWDEADEIGSRRPSVMDAPAAAGAGADPTVIAALCNGVYTCIAPVRPCADTRIPSLLLSSIGDCFTNGGNVHHRFVFMASIG